MPPKKHLSGYEKRKKRKLEEQSKESQKGAIHKFIQSQRGVTESQKGGIHTMSMQYQAFDDFVCTFVMNMQ